MRNADWVSHDEQTEAIRAGIARARADVATSLLALERQVRANVAWRTWVLRRPLWALAAALTLGWWMGSRRFWR
jgi:hypothetical protein